MTIKKPTVRKRTANGENRSGILQVTLNGVMTWDARISSPADGRCFLESRADADAILIGDPESANVAVVVDERLQALRIARGRSCCPLCVAVSDSGTVEPGLPVFGCLSSPVVLFSTSRMSASTRASLEGRATMHLSEGEEVDLRAMLEALANGYGVQRLVCEGDPVLFRRMLEADLVDEINLVFRPTISGGEIAPTLTGAAGEFLPSTRQCRLEAMETMEGECLVRYAVCA